MSKKQLDIVVFQCTSNPGHKEFDFNLERIPKWRKCLICGKRARAVKEDKDNGKRT